MPGVFPWDFSKEENLNSILEEETKFELKM